MPSVKTDCVTEEISRPAPKKGELARRSTLAVMAGSRINTADISLADESALRLIRKTSESVCGSDESSW